MLAEIMRDSNAKTLLNETKKNQEHRFKKQMGADAWARLHKDVRARFSRKLKIGESIIYKGVITQTRFNVFGRWVAQLARIIGAPLPLECHSAGTPAIVSVTHDPTTDGQFWTRSYGRKAGFPQVIHSSKQFNDNGLIEEHIGHGIGMLLRTSEKNGAMLFTSEGYFIEIGKYRLSLPQAVMPGTVKVEHQDIGDHYFAFILTLTHPIFGKLIYQRGVFCEASKK